jgi:hypothetical protein
MQEQTQFALLALFAHFCTVCHFFPWCDSPRCKGLPDRDAASREMRGHDAYPLRNAAIGMLPLYLCPRTF